MRRGEVGVEFDGGLHQPDGISPIEVEASSDQGPREVGFWQFGLEGHGPLGRHLGYAASSDRTEKSVDPENRVDVGYAGVGKGVIGVLLDAF
jgi:hypothetical protein